MAHKLFQVGVKALITDDSGRVLLCKALSWKKILTHWDLPGGRLETGETAEDTLIREIAEETGITEVRNIKFFSACISNFEVPLSETEIVGLVLMAYSVEVPKDSPIKLSDEHSTYEWVSFAEAAKRLAYKYPKDFTDALVS